MWELGKRFTLSQIRGAQESLSSFQGGGDKDIVNSISAIFLWEQFFYFEAGLHSELKWTGKCKARKDVRFSTKWPRGCGVGVGARKGLQSKHSTEKV